MMRVPPAISDKGKGKGKSEASARANGLSSTLSFLTLPPELREHIYTVILDEEPSSLTDLLAVNQKLYREVKPFSYKLPRTFDGQSELFSWLDEIDHDFLKYVVDIRFKLHDINCDEIVGALGKRLREANLTRAGGSRGSDTGSNPYYEACHLELKRIGSAFHLLSNLKSFTILTATRSDPKPPTQMILNFAWMLGHCFPNLHSLVSEENMIPVDFVANKSRLRRLRFPAVSTSEEDAVAKAFRNLADLELEICRLPQHRRQVEEGWGCASEVLGSVAPLRSLTLYESREFDSANLMAEIFLDSEDSLRRHIGSVRRLKLLANLKGPRQAMRARMQGNLVKFIRASSLKLVEVTDTYTELYRHLPHTVETFVLRLDRPNNRSCAFDQCMDDLLSHVKYRFQDANDDEPECPELSSLADIKIVMAHGSAWEAPVPKRFESARSRLRQIGIRLTLVFNDGDMVTGSEPYL